VYGDDGAQWTKCYPYIWAKDTRLASYKNIYWIAGGVAKEGGIEPLTDLFGNITKSYLIGEAAKPFAKTLKKHKVDSPACASFDQFKDFEIRGDAFRGKAKEIIAIFEREVASNKARKNKPAAKSGAAA